MNKNHVAFGEDEMYVGGFNIPEGHYILQYRWRMSTPKEGSQNAPRLVVELIAHDLNDPERQGDNAYTELLGTGKATLSFAPDPDDDAKLISIPGAAGVTINDQTSWNIHRRSLYNSGLPKGILVDDFNSINGMHVYLKREPEPEARKGFAKSATGENSMFGVASEERGPKTIPVVSEIKEDGKPWEGTGGLLTGEAKPKGKGATKIAPKAIANPVPVKKAPVTAPVGADGDDILTAAIAAASSVIPVGGLASVILLRTKMASVIKKSDGDDMFQAVADTYFQDNDSTNALLEHVGFTISGTKVVPVS